MHGIWQMAQRNGILTQIFKEMHSDKKFHVYGFIDFNGLINHDNGYYLLH